MAQIVECGHSMKAFDLEKLQSLTLSGEKITKEIFEALFVNESPYYYSTQTNGLVPFNYTAPAAAFEDPPMAPCQYTQSSSVDMKNFEIFRGAFDAAANCSRTATTEIAGDYQFYDNRFYQGQSYFQSY